MADGAGLRLAIVLQTPKDPQSAVYLGYLSIASALQRAGAALEILAPSDFPSVQRFGGRWVPFVYPVAVARWMWRGRRDFDLVMFHSYAGWLATGLRLRAGTPAMVMFHGVEPMYHEELRREAAADGHPLSRRYRMLQELLMPVMLRIACRTANAVVCLNRAEAEYLAARGWAPPQGARVLPHGIPDRFFAPPRTIAAVRTVLFVGQWLPMKGIRYLREAAAILLARHSEMRLICAGTLAGADAVLAQFPETIRARITVLPRVDQARLAQLYGEADAFVFPSLYEGFSRAIVEAMAAGLPIVTTSVGVAADALRDGDNAIVIPKRSAPAIVDALERLRGDAAYATALGTAAAAAADHYRRDVIQQDTIRFILQQAGART